MPKKKDIRSRLSAFINYKWTEVGIAILIVLSVVLVVWEAVGSKDADYRRWIMIASDVLTFVFIVELSIRFWVERRKSRFFKKYWLDILSVLPTLRILRVLRIVRLFRVGVTFSRHFRLFSSARSFIKLEYMILSLAVTISILMGAVAMRFLEGKSNNDFNVFEDAVWFATMTLIGGEPIGGDPQTTLGKVVTLLLMMGGLTVFAIVTGTVSAVMTDSIQQIRMRSMDLEELEDHIVICGWSRTSELVLDELFHEDDFEHFVVISEATEPMDSSVISQNHHRLHWVVGDYTRLDVLREARIETAAVAMLLYDDSKEERSTQDQDARTVLAAMLIEKINEDIHTTVQLHNRDNETSLKSVGVEEIIVTDDFVGNIMASVVRNKGMFSVLDELLTSKRGDQFYRCEPPDSVVGKTIAEAMVILKRDSDATLIAIQDDNGETDVNPPSDHVITKNDILFVASTSPL